MRRLLLVLLAILVIFAAGCGTARVDLKTDVLSPTELDQEISVRGDGVLGDAVRQTFNADKLRSEGWATDYKADGAGFAMTAKKRMTGSESWLPGTSISQSGPTASDTKYDFKVTDGLFDREYRLSIVMPPQKVSSASPPKTEQERQMQQAGEQMIKSAFKMSWTVNLPGEVTETNADSKSKSGGTWDLSLDRLQSGVEMRIASRERKDFTLPVVGLVAILGAGAGGALWLRRRKGGG